MQINNGNENIEVSSKLAKKLTKEDLNAGDTQAVNKAIFESIDKNKDGEITTDELAAMLSTLDTDGDGKVTDSEITAAVDKIENVKAEKKTEYINFLKNMAAKNAEKVANSDNVGNSYVVQLGEQFPDLIKRIMKAQGEKEDDITESSDVYKKYVAQFKADNPNAFKAKDGGDGVSWLYAGVKVYIRTDSQNAEKAYIKDKANVSEVEEDYRNWVSGGKKAFTYNAEKPNAYRKTEGADDSGAELATVSVDFSNYENSDYGAYNKDKVQEKVNKAVEIINKLKDKSNIEKIERNNSKLTVTLKDGTEIKIIFDNNNKISAVWVDVDGKKGTDNKKHTDVAFKSDGTLFLNMDNNSKTDLTIKKEGAFDFDEISEIAEFASKEKSDISVSTIIKTDKINYGNFNKEQIDEKIQQATDVLAKLSGSSNIKTIKKPVNKGTYESITIELYDNSSVEVRFKNNEIIGVFVNTDGKGKQDVGFYKGKLFVGRNDQDKWDISSDNTVNTAEIKKLIPKEVTDKIKAQFTDTDKQKNYVLRFSMNVNNNMSSANGSITVTSPNGKIYTVTNSDLKTRSGNKYTLLENLCIELKNRLKKDGWTNITLINPKANAGTNYKRSAQSTSKDLDKTKAYTTYVAYDKNAKVAGICFPDGVYQKYTNITDDPTQNKGILEDIKKKGWTNMTLIKSSS